MKQQALDEEAIEEQLSHAVHLVERELHFFVDEDYPLIKFWNQYDEIVWYREMERREHERQNASRLR